jgi:membrane protease YdiL (CAAX protease family)
MDNKSNSRAALINITIFVEAGLLLVATFWTYHAGYNLAEKLIISPRYLAIGAFAGILMAASSLLLLKLDKVFPPVNQLKNIVQKYLVPLVSNLNLIDLIAIALISGFCEEVFFRGIMQQKFGLLLTSLIFGIFHDPFFQFVSYSLLALIYGLVLGALYQWTHNLWAPITAHFVHNLISLIFLRYFIKPIANDETNQADDIDQTIE